MRVLQVIQTLKAGGAERVCADLATALSCRGHQVKILLLQDRREIDVLDVSGKVEVQCLLPRESPVWVRALFRLVASFRNIYRQGWDAVHCHMDGALAVAAIGGARPLCYTVHNSEHAHWKGMGLHRSRSALEWWNTRRRSTLVVGCGPAASGWAQSHISHGRPVLCIPNGINLQGFRFKNEPWTPRKPIQILMVGKLAPAKDYGTAIRALHAMIQDGVEAELRIAGEGALLDQLRSLAECLGLARRIHFLGRHNRVADLYASSDLFWLTSRHEGLPLVLLEALACGLPAVVTDVSGIREIARLTRVHTVPESDFSQLSQATQSLLQNRAATERHWNRRVIESQFSTERMVDDYLALYNRNHFPQIPTAQLSL